ncbi:MAG: two-component system response regulator PhoP [Cycloclasticus pugetii]|jgi:two-component system response regulator PhoP|uniref:Two-component system response regulator n=2 Tax=Cycloclasticus TaxID=34067 RepID=S5T723_9GAMM|nr:MULTISPECIES: response regulator transcription factor [Cycloclasticus]AFT67212.1 Response regulator consisting of a CheY-like receiver domain and a winged-helix DNA-binding domain protein [Cycloclasticus sp. P1]AGS39581.1 Two-component system response regulator [Cycloclasticus zancles 78-ME]ATI03177.1 DNA-binding response regulator [Cycloclasticus sp. PY97N]EPD12614.1 response regulator [Cycloclasticus pugetii]MBV1899865.1 response regulator transcription factor [Cycloclasticus sp.]
MRVLVVEDDQSLQEQLVENLTKRGFAVDATDNGTDALYFGTEYPIDIAIVDLGLPDIPGMEVIKQLRAKDINFPILILTARARWEEKVEGLEAGADDYLVKPFHTEELLARMNALIRRSAGVASPMLVCGPISLDSSAQQVLVDEKPVVLTAYEYKMLEYMMMHSGKVISKTEITEHIYDQDFDRDSNVIEVFVGRLRKKLDPNDQHKPIETLRGRGYRFSIPLNH